MSTRAEVATLQPELIEAQLAELDFRSPDLPEVLVVPDMLIDKQTRANAARFIGAVTLEAEGGIELVTDQAPIASLQEAIVSANVGDPEGRAIVETCVGTDVIERTIKTGHVMNPVKLTIMIGGKTAQHGQSTDAIQANSLRYAANHPTMRLRTEAETRNKFRIEELNRAGLLDEYYFGVVSRAEHLPGFFTDTMSCCIQITGKQGNDLLIESAFVSGIAIPGSKVQHDEATVAKMGQKLKVNFAGKTPAQIIDTPFLILKASLPNGAIDLVKLYDDCAGGTFFGEDKPRQDYSQYLEYCRQREQTFAPKIQDITSELLASADSIHSPVEAIDKLHELSEKHMVEKAIEDITIDPRVFGPVSAGYILQARVAVEQGDWGGLDRFMQKAKDTAQSTSCPGKIMFFDGQEDNTDAKDSDDDCDFVSQECPVCHKKDVKTRVTKTHVSGDCGCKVKRQQHFKG